MKRYFTIILLIVALCFHRNTLHAQEYSDTVMVDEPVDDNREDDNGSGTSNSDEHEYERIYMDEHKLESMRSKKEFQYQDIDSLGQRDTLFLEPEKTTTQRRNRFEGFNANILVWLVIAVAIVVIILQLTGVNMRQLFTPGRLKKMPDSGELVSENIHDIPYESAIQQAILAKNYSLATRLMYLQSLKSLSDKGLIAWHENKTNWQYVYELRNETLRNSFRTITSIFEYVQYGHMPISEEKFAVVQESFRNFKTNVI